MHFLSGCRLFNAFEISSSINKEFARVSQVLDLLYLILFSSENIAKNKFSSFKMCVLLIKAGAFSNLQIER